MTQTVYVGVDDTDILGGVGTGRVARGLANHIENLGLAKSTGVSRHQLLVDNRIKYTSHNSSKGIALVVYGQVSDLYEPSVSYMRSCFVAGSDPGLCICPENKVTAEIMDYGVSSQRRLLSREDAMELAAKYDIFLRELGGDGGGVIGALAAVGLRAGGNDGRLVDLRGIREIAGLISVGELKRRTDIVAVQDTQGQLIPDDAIIDSLDWIKPSLIGGRPVLRVKPVQDNTGRQMWQPAEMKQREKSSEGKKEEKHGQ